MTKARGRTQQSKTAQDLIDAVAAELRADNAATRREKIETLASARKGWPGIKWALKQRKGTWFTTDQTPPGRKGSDSWNPTLKLIVNGRHAADLRLSAEGSPKLHAPKKRPRGLPSFPSHEPLAWSKNVHHAKLIRKYIQSCQELPANAPEFNVQLQLFEQLNGKGGERKAGGPWDNIVAVMPFGFATEMPTVVKSNGKAGTGNIDILARSGTGNASEFVVIELKKPTLRGRKPVREAFEQAIRYAAALSLEANGSQEGNPLPHVADYWLLCGPEPKLKPGHKTKQLVVHAAVALPAHLKKHAEDVLDSLDLRLPPRVRGIEMRIGLLLYQVNENHRLDIRHTGWEKDHGTWSPRRRRSLTC